jgi:Zn-dependent peptidase ImmA (M78 family)
VAIDIPYRTIEELSGIAAEFLEKHNANETIPVPIEQIVETGFGMDIVPMPGLQQNWDVEAFITRDLTEIRVDEYVFMNRLKRYRFSLAHELGHRVLHGEYWREMEFDDIASWKQAQADISGKVYGGAEFQANTFAGCVLVPTQPLGQKIGEWVQLAGEKGVDVGDIATGAREFIEEKVALDFEVSHQVVSIRMERSGMWDEFV